MKPKNRPGVIPEQKKEKMKTTTYDISISANGIWAGDGKYDHRDNGQTVTGSIRDCSAILGGTQDKAEEIYEAIEDAITEMDSPNDGKLEIDGVIYDWTLTPREPAAFVI